MYGIENHRLREMSSTLLESEVKMVWIGIGMIGLLSIWVDYKMANR